MLRFACDLLFNAETRSREISICSPALMLDRVLGESIIWSFGPIHPQTTVRSSEPLFAFSGLTPSSSASQQSSYADGLGCPKEERIRRGQKTRSGTLIFSIFEVSNRKRTTHQDWSIRRQNVASACSRLR
jgi:hypothetical protein